MYIHIYIDSDIDIDIDIDRKKDVSLSHSPRSLVSNPSIPTRYDPLGPETVTIYISIYIYT